ncbi:MAG: hypothetical protein AB7R69_06680 [Candidatus Babeliales bacterium]
MTRHYHKLHNERSKNKLSGNLSAPLCHYIAKQPHPLKDQMANLFVYILLRHLKKHDNDATSLNEKIKFEQNNMNANAEGALRDILALKDIQNLPDIMYGQSIPIELRVLWQQLGMDPDSDNEVFEFFEKNNIDYLSPEKPSHESLQTTASKYTQSEPPKSPRP